MMEIFGTKYLTDKEASHRYGYSVSWFQKARYKNISPPYMRLQGKGRVFHPVTETDEWFKNNMMKVDW